MAKLKIILDTNFLLIPETHGVDIFSEINRIISKDYELLIPKAVIEELKGLKSNEDPSIRRAAKIGLELSKKTEIISSKKKADEEIIRLAKEPNIIVATNDTELKKKLRNMKTPVIYLRQKSYLQIAGNI